MRLNQGIYFEFSNSSKSNGLGNVRAVISDRKFTTGSENENYLAELLSATDYYAYGLPLYGRKYVSQSGSYRFGFNTQEKVDEISGEGNHNTALFWEYDNRLGRRWNTDPVLKEWESPYACLGDNPILLNDLDGDVAGNPDNYDIYENGTQTKTETEDNTNTYTYHKNDGSKITLAVLPKTTIKGKDFVTMPAKGISYTQVYGFGNQLFPEDAAAGFLGASYKYYAETGYKTKVNQFMGPNTSHKIGSTKKVDKALIDIHYIGKKGTKSFQPNTFHGNVDEKESFRYAKYFLDFGFGDGTSYSLITLGKDGKTIFPGYSASSPHQHHIHIQGFKSKIQKVHSQQVTGRFYRLEPPTRDPKLSKVFESYLMLGVSIISSILKQFSY